MSPDFCLVPPRRPEDKEENATDKEKHREQLENQSVPMEGLRDACSENRCSTFVARKQKLSSHKLTSVLLWSPEIAVLVKSILEGHTVPVNHDIVIHTFRMGRIRSNKVRIAYRPKFS